MSRTIQTHLVESDREGKLEEFLYDDGSATDVAVVAPYGGGVEPNTDTQALQIAEQFDGVVCWGTRGYAQGSSRDRWHTKLSSSPASEFPLLAEFVDRDFSTVISLRTMAAGGVVLGGTASAELKHVVQAYLWSQDLSVVRVDVPTVDGGSVSVVDRLVAEDGVTMQFEQGLGVVGNYPERVVGGIATWLSDQMRV